MGGASGTIGRAAGAGGEDPVASFAVGVSMGFVDGADGLAAGVLRVMDALGALYGSSSTARGAQRAQTYMDLATTRAAAAVSFFRARRAPRGWALALVMAVARGLGPS